jgi:two-component system, OmpR family, response regulator
MPTKNGFVTNLLGLQDLKILVVDNHIDSCDLIELLLAFYGVRVKKAFLAKQALEIFGTWEPDILITEIALPEVDGFTLVRQARAIAVEREKVLLVIAVTAYISEEMRQLALSTGFDYWFTKPLNLDNFVAGLAYYAGYKFSSAMTQTFLSSLVNHRDVSFEEHQPNLNLSGVY